MNLEIIAREPRTLARAARLTIGNRHVLTPARTIGLTRSDKVELDVARQVLSPNAAALAEVYARVTPDTLAKIHDDDDFGARFSSGLALRLDQVQDSGGLGYLILHLTNEDGTAFNRPPPARMLTLIFDLLWGTPKNHLVVPPLAGALQSERAYLQIFQRLKERVRGRTDRRDTPLVGLVPSSYRLIAPKLIEGYWKLGCRLFAFDFENRKFAAYGYVIERLVSELTQLSDRAGEPYALHALNSKFRTGRGETLRVNDLLAAGFGFDTYGPNHVVRRRWMPPGRPALPVESTYLLDPTTYGFMSITDLTRNTAIRRRFKSEALSDRGPQNLSSLASEKIVRICRSHNVETELREVGTFGQIVGERGLGNYFSSKTKVQGEASLIRKIGQNALSSEEQRSLDTWFE